MKPKKSASSHLFALHHAGLSRLSASWLLGETYEIASPALTQRITKILRLRPHEWFILFDESGNMHLEFEYSDKGRIGIRLIKRSANPVVQPQIRLYVGLTKKSSFEQVAYSAAQLGVGELCPLSTERSRQDWGGKQEETRLRALMVAAREQAKSFEEPHLHAPRPLANAVKNLNSSHNGIFFELHHPPLWSALEKLRSKGQEQTINLFFGPEGGFSSSEVKLLQAAGVDGSCLTPTTLRTEDAVLLGAGALISLLV